ncbi:PTS sugar transporter subunit IIC [Bacillus mycoides]|uniref:PTS transporter subunit IIC n=1 Tax=Bacillus mycoides TaxID=1405 RepID=UPI001C01B785|nr:PTS sugar transporter subunit IIC [Bacillus mycoides]QWG73702.1 PTS sugar transporter subunit IIC [Bacillus mycoides]QWH25514.1 PTS sugar transporter subunit IIC [Bacillus mycoides]
MKEYIMSRVFKASAGIAQGIFVSLGIGLLIENIGRIVDIPLLITIGVVAKSLMAPAIGAGIAFMLGANGLVIFSAMVAGAIGAGSISITEAGLIIKTGEPIGALLTATLAVYIGKRLSGKTALDMMLVPFAAILGSGLVGIWLAQNISPFLNTVGAFIKDSSAGSPLIASIVIAVVWGLLLISPASSAALAIALSLDGVAGGAALAGCVAQFIGFSVISAKENNLGGILAQALCTPKVQLPNITKNPMILVPTVVASAIVGPVSALIFQLEAGKEIAGLGLSSLIAPINLISSQGWEVVPAMVITYIIIPVAVSYILYIALKKAGRIHSGDMTVPQS